MPKLSKKLCRNCFSDMSGKVCAACGYTNKRRDGSGLFLQRGTELNSRFIIGGVIGNGGFGVTYMAYDLKNEKKIAIKEYFPKTIAARRSDGSVYSVETSGKKIFAEGAEKFYREAEYVYQFNGNSNIVSVFDYFYANNTAYLAMEYLSGITLENYIKNYGVLSEAQTVYIAERLAMALIIIHSAQLLHRDISPDNIMLCRDGRVKLIDFGAARIFTAENLPRFTVIMKSGFAPIEQYSINGDFGEWTDIYSLGTVLYYALTGKIPPNPYERIVCDAELDFGENNFNKKLCGIIAKAAGISSEERYKNASELKNDIAELRISSEKIAIPDDHSLLKHTFNDVPEKNQHRKNAGRLITVLTAEAVALTAAFISGTAFDPSGKTSDPIKDHTIENSTTENNTAENTATESSVTENSTVKNSAVIDFDGKQKELYEFDGIISAELLKSFESDVEITYNFSVQGTSWTAGFIPTDSDGNYLIKYITGDYISAQEHGYISVDKSAESCSFVLSSEGIESLGDNDFGIYNYDLVLLSAEIKTGSEKAPVSYCSYTDIDFIEPMISEENGEKIVTADLTDTDETARRYPNTWDGYTTWGIPAYAFKEFDGDILVTLEIEHTNTEDDHNSIFYVYDCGMAPHPAYKAIILDRSKDKSGNYLTERVFDGVSVSKDITECSFTIPQEAVGNILGGIHFGEDHLLIKSVRLASAEKEE